MHYNYMLGVHDVVLVDGCGARLVEQLQGAVGDVVRVDVGGIVGHRGCMG